MCVPCHCSHLGAGLKALKLLNKMIRPEREEQWFPTLETVNEEDEGEIEVDPDDAEKGSAEPGWEWNAGDDDSVECDVTGMGFTLKKIDYICRRIASPPQKQAERVIKQLLDNKDNRCAQGQAVGGHFFKSYEISAKEWEEVRQLNVVLKYFLDLTKQFEGDGPYLTHVLYQYVRVLENLAKQKTAAALSSLTPMFDPMIKVTNKYLNLAINCHTVILATFLHPAWRMMLFNTRFKTHVTRITERVQETFKDREILINSLKPKTPAKATQSDPDGDAGSQSDSDGGQFNFTLKICKRSCLDTTVASIDTHNTALSTLSFQIRQLACDWARLDTVISKRKLDNKTQAQQGLPLPPLAEEAALKEPSRLESMCAVSGVDSAAKKSTEISGLVSLELMMMGSKTTISRLRQNFGFIPAEATVDHLVIGAGVVGLAIARELTNSSEIDPPLLLNGMLSLVKKQARGIAK
ncbi:hypothetical protein KEM48_003333 [Puccinia striiformis f. sp. tritici PST-130]|nr:hypothetical protein KEM48_003333 [Puccinia striiformis f. sp. tritici PST-130]